MNEELSHNELGGLIGALLALVTGGVGWLVAGLTGTYRVGRRSAALEDQLTNLRQEVTDLRAWREAFLKEHIDLQIRLTVLESRGEKD